VLRLDCRGRPCPVPVIELAKAIGAVPVGGLVEVVSDDPAAAHDIPAWCRLRAQGFESRREVEGGACYAVRRKN
jgi:TusA-related sulfurtransferase